MGYLCLFQFWFPQGIYLGVGLLGLMVVLFLVFSRNHHTIFHSGFINLHSHQQCKRVPFFSTPSPAFIVYRFFNEGHSDHCEVISHCTFDLHFSNNERSWASFHVLGSHLYVFEKRSKSFSHFLIGLFVFLVLSCMSCLHILEINPCQLFHLLLFSPILRAVFSPHL